MTRERLAVVKPSSDSAQKNVRPVDTIVPVMAVLTEHRIGYVVRREGFQGEQCYAEIRVDGMRVLIPCRRANRAEDPYGVYILADGSLWRSAFPQTLPIVAEVIQ